MEMWQRIIQSIDKNLPLEQILQNLAETIQVSLDVKACNIFLKDNQSMFTLMATTLTPLLAGLIHIHIKHDAVGQAVIREKTVIIDDIYQYNTPTTLSAFSREKLRGLLCVPIIHTGSVIGIITVQSLSKANFSENLQTTLVTLCLNISDILTNFIEKGSISQLVSKKKSRNKTVSLAGKAVTTGTAIGHVVLKYNIFDIENIPDKTSQDENEVEQFISALNEVKASINLMLQQIHSQTSENESALFDAYIKMIDSNSYSGAIIDLIKGGCWIQTAIKKVTEHQVTTFNNMVDPYLRARACDLKDISIRILIQLQEKAPIKQNYPLDTILIANEVTPSMVAEIPKGRLKAIISEKGTETSHASILARALGIPFIINVTSLPTDYLEGKLVVVDAYASKLFVNPSKGIIDSYKRLLRNEVEKETKLKEVAQLPCIMTDQHVVDIQANVGFIADLDIALEKGSMGIGLYRTEIPFMIRDKFPSEDEQRIIYSQFLKAFPKNNVTIRTLDVGADKALPYFSTKEDNPALGWRGIRMLLDHTNIFLIQIRAMLKASEKLNNLRILLPMITDVSEIKEATKLIKRARKELLLEGYDIKAPEIGIMIEVPSVVFELPHILKYVNFVSVGTNDLAQYILAIDRNNEKVSHLYSSFHPAVIQALYQIAIHAREQKKPVSICGEMAGNPLATALLIGMGYNSLSMNPVNILKSKWILRSLSYTTCQNILKQVLLLHSKTEIEAYLTNFLLENNLGGMIRAGN
jgi:phosphotransferase system enzyme I (PtsP)